MKKILLLSLLSSLMFREIITYKAIDYVVVDYVMYERIKYTTKDHNGNVINTKYEYNKIINKNKYY